MRKTPGNIIISAVIGAVMSVGFFTSLYGQSVKPLRIGVDGTYPPFSHRNLDGEFSGLDIDLANALCKAMKSKCTFQQVEWDDLASALGENRIDLAVASMAINDRSRTQVQFTAPYLQLPSAVIIRKDSLLSGLAAQDMKNAQLGVINSSPHGEYVRTHFPDAKISQYENQQDYFLDLINRRLDAVVGNGVLLYNWLNSDDGKNCCRLLGTLPYDNQINGEGVAIAVRMGDDQLLDRLNKALKSIQASGRNAKIIGSYLPFLN